jgi:hypothetical protein
MQKNIARSGTAKVTKFFLQTKSYPFFLSFFHFSKAIIAVIQAFNSFG